MKQQILILRAAFYNLKKKKYFIFNALSRHGRRLKASGCWNGIGNGAEFSPHVCLSNETDACYGRYFLYKQAWLFLRRAPLLVCWRGIGCSSESRDSLPSSAFWFQFCPPAQTLAPRVCHPQCLAVRVSRTHFIPGYIYQCTYSPRELQMTGRSRKWRESAAAKRAAACWLSCWNDMPGQWWAEPRCQLAEHLLAVSVESSHEVIFHAFLCFVFASFSFSLPSVHEDRAGVNTRCLVRFTSHSSTSGSQQGKCLLADVLTQPEGVFM